MAFPASFLDELVARSDIVEIVSDYVQLTKKSGSNMFGLCPFHSEKTPSFAVSPDKQIYHCFGCGKGGGVINFIMEIENLPFPDAVAFLARRAGMQVPDDDTPAEVRSRRERMLALNRDAARFFYGCLSRPEGAAAVEYIKKRGISPAMVRRFGLGAAPDAWNTLSDAMTAKGYTPAELLDAGLVKKGKSGGMYDVFRNRLVFPVIDVRGSVIGFSGRILDDGEPKYLNSPDTAVFQKSRNLFALNLAKKTKRGYLILVEGNVDVVSLHQAGFDCAVASLGTSLTPEQARLISRYTDHVVVSYDADAAGVKAAQRAIGIFDRTGVAVRVLRVEGAKDPDEFIKAKGAAAFENLLAKSENHVQYRIDAIRGKYDLETDDGRLGFLAEATDTLSQLPNAVEREIYGRKVAELTGVSPEAVMSEVKKAFRRRVEAIRKKREKEELRPAAAAQPKERALRYENAASATAEEGVVRLLLMDPELAPAAASLTSGDFTSPFLGKVFAEIMSRAGAGAVSPAAVAARLTPDEASRFTELMQRPESPANAERAMADYIEKIKTEMLKRTPEGALMAVRNSYKKRKGLGG